MLLWIVDVQQFPSMGTCSQVKLLHFISEVILFMFFPWIIYLCVGGKSFVWKSIYWISSLQIHIHFFGWKAIYKQALIIHG